MNSNISRRRFLANSAATVGALAALPKTMAGAAPARAARTLPMHSLPMPADGIYKVAFSDVLESATPANLDRSGKSGWIGKFDGTHSPTYPPTTHYIIEARNHAGDKLWDYDTGVLSYFFFGNTAHAPLAVWDFSLRGIDDVVVVRYATTGHPPVRAEIVLLDGETGEELSTIAVPWPSGTAKSPSNFALVGCKMTVAFLDGPNRPASFILCLGTYIDGACFAFDVREGEIHHRWTYQHVFYLGSAHHGVTAFDINGDGRDEILMGSTVIDADGCKIFSFSDTHGYGHADFVLPGQIDPDLPGIQLLFGFEFGYGVALTSPDGKIHWHRKDAFHAHQGWVAKVRPDLPGEQIRVINKLYEDTFFSPHPGMLEDMDRTELWSVLLDAKGKDIDLGTFTNALRPPEWNGDELHEPWEAVLAEVGIERGRYRRMIACDLGGGPLHGAEEIVGFRDNEMTVYFNQNAKPFASRWANQNYRRMVVSSISSGYWRKETYRVLHPPVRVYPPTAFVAVEGERDIGFRSQESGASERVLTGKKFILFRGKRYRFLGSTSWDSNGGHIESHEWDWGDGTRSTEADPVKYFPRNGTYGVTLTVRVRRKLSREHVTVEVQDQVLQYVARTPHVIEIDSFDEGSRLYIDRDDRAVDVPEELKGLSLIRTHHELEARRSSTMFAFDMSNIPVESIHFRTPVETEVLVAMDEYRKDHPAMNLYEYYNMPDPHAESLSWPPWIEGNEWQRTDLSVGNTVNGRRHVIYKKHFGMDEIVRIGPNRRHLQEFHDYDRNMYFILLRQVRRPYDARSVAEFLMEGKRA